MIVINVINENKLKVIEQKSSIKVNKEYITENDNEFPIEYIFT